MKMKTTNNLISKLFNPPSRGGWTATRRASWEICMRFGDWLHSRVDLSEVNISRIEVFERRDSRAVILQENSTVELCHHDSFYDVAFTDPSILF